MTMSYDDRFEQDGLTTHRPAPKPRPTPTPSD